MEQCEGGLVFSFSFVYFSSFFVQGAGEGRYGSSLFSIDVVAAKTKSRR